MRCWCGYLSGVRFADCLRMVQLMPLHPKTPSSLASFKSRLVLAFWYRLTQVVLEKRPLNRCSSSCSSSLLSSKYASLPYFYCLSTLKSVRYALLQSRWRFLVHLVNGVCVCVCVCACACACACSYWQRRRTDSVYTERVGV